MAHVSRRHSNVLPTLGVCFGEDSLEVLIVMPFNALQVEQDSRKAAQQASELQAAERRVRQLTEQDEAKSRELQAARNQLQAVEAEEQQLQESVARLGEDLSQLRWGGRAWLC